MYIKVKNNLVAKYPYSLSDLKKDNKDTSFPDKITDETLAEYGVYPYTLAEEPTYNELTEDIVLGTPTEVDGAWTQSYSVVQKSQEDAERNIREQRNFLLLESDWTQIPDCTVDKTAWATYRQALRDITDQEGFPYTVTWPDKPE